MKDRVFRGGEEGLIGYWHMGNATAGEVPSVIAGGYSGRLVGNIGVTTLPAINLFLVPGQLELVAAVAYAEADAAFDEGAYDQAASRFEDMIHPVCDYKDAVERRDAAKRQWDLAEAAADYAEGSRLLSSSGAAQAYWAFDRVIAKLLNYKDAPAKRVDAHQTATYDVGLSVFLSSKVRESLAHQEEKCGSRCGRLGSSLDKVSRKSQIGGTAFVEAEDLLYSRLEWALDDRRAPYVRL